MRKTLCERVTLREIEESFRRCVGRSVLDETSDPKEAPSTASGMSVWFLQC